MKRPRIRNPYSWRDWKTIVLHMVLGLFVAWLLAGPVTLKILGAALLLGFYSYEWMEQVRIRDKGFKDVAGFMLGLGTYAVLLWGWQHFR